MSEMVVGLCGVVTKLNREKSHLETKVENLLEYIRFVEKEIVEQDDWIGGDFLTEIKTRAGYKRPKYIIDRED